MAIGVMSEIGIDISGQRSKAINEIDLAGADLIVTLCDDEVCPMVPPAVRRLHWGIADPAASDPALPQEELLARFRTARGAIHGRILVLRGLLSVPVAPAAEELHLTLRVADLEASVRFYSWLLGRWPAQWSDRHAVYLCPNLHLNFVLVVAETGRAGTVHHLGIGLADRAAVLAAYRAALALDARVEKPPLTTWKGTPLHELWLRDPDGSPIEAYARMTDRELRQRPADRLPESL